MKKILFIEDDLQFQSVIAEVLRFEEYNVDVANNAAEGLQLFKQNVYDLVISDVKMEGVDGITLLSVLQKFDAQVKVILLSASNDEDDEVRGLELNAVDFIKKPVSIRVLLTRIDRALHKSKFYKKDSLLESKGQHIRVDLLARKVTKHDEAVGLTAMEFELLVYLMKNKQKVLSREQIVRKVWQVNELAMDLRNVDTHIKKLRNKLQLTCVHSIRGVGYEWAE
ncbi:response regulator transcription factor [Culicoidibacter larvae]|uniref:Response regulator transcription factor n=1 Tax=Culicoidibacter larvae TaxID=2579976 RepID=A0A5R8QHF4_9FIRM|nr:response regulator transcription factor [Culicoidibacter larvae]TLG77471.1 response regulator transcription factor [Culicoidibacter larvae]